MHQCHANGCDDGAHPEAPFCKRHFQMLPEPHRKKLWSGRRKDGVCGACDPRECDEVPLRAAPNWYGLFNLGVAILLVAEYDACGAPPEMHDEEGFCWGCGVDKAEATYTRAQRAVSDFNITGL